MKETSSGVVMAIELVSYGDPWGHWGSDGGPTGFDDTFTVVVGLFL